MKWQIALKGVSSFFFFFFHGQIYLFGKQAASKASDLLRGGVGGVFFFRFRDMYLHSRPFGLFFLNNFFFFLPPILLWVVYGSIYGINLLFINLAYVTMYRLHTYVDRCHRGSIRSSVQWNPKIEKKNHYKTKL